METSTTVSNTHRTGLLLRAQDVADQLNISKSLAYRLLQQGHIPTVRFNRTVRVRLVDLETFIQQCWQGVDGFPNPE